MKPIIQYTKSSKNRTDTEYAPVLMETKDVTTDISTRHITTNVQYETITLLHQIKTLLLVLILLKIICMIQK